MIILSTSCDLKARIGRSLSRNGGDRHHRDRCFHSLNGDRLSICLFHSLTRY
ncbi:hypothetical protein [Phormidium sp. CCY1219]|uniref:hypothetical protein n=1 Tax=Phormidium sp. CCY1219 TaxID=2886104 RepID=UPI002D1E6549|nr:hypothetical protein [Phormidium sp. CCY1219]MEB3830057.1 hypothetical protein [Phormidium sp. CCY1219]